MVLDGKTIKHQETANYITAVNAASMPINNYWTDLNTAIGRLDKNSNNYRNKKIEILQEFQIKLQKAILAIQQIKTPNFLENYHTLKIQQANYALQYCSQLILAEQSPDETIYYKHIDQCNEAVTLFNQTTQNLKPELIRVFEDIDMDYAITPTGVTFRYQR
jgi:hypothetical protein